MNRIFLLSASILAIASADAASPQEFSPRIYSNSAGATLPYRLLIPENYQPSEKYPLVLFLHGAGERGTNNSAQLVHGTTLYQQPENRKNFPSFVLAPQCPTGQKWVDMPWDGDTGVQPPQPSAPMKLVLELLETLPKEFSIDPQRLYVTGLSMGGYGTWDLITRFPERFAAAAPICGGGDESSAPRAAKVPIWAFHSDDDTVVKVLRTRNMITAIQKAGGQPKYFEYWGLGHNSWTTAYKEPEFLPWMFAQRRGQKDPVALRSRPSEIPAVGRLPNPEDSVAGTGPIRQYDWFRSLWRQKRLGWAKETPLDQGAVVFLGDSITQGWGSLLSRSFPGMKVANRGISGDTSRGVLYRLPEDVLSLNPRAVVLLIGTNDLEERAEPEVVAGNVRLILDALSKHNAKMPVVLCLVMPSSATKQRPTEKIQRLNELLVALGRDRSQLTLVDTWTLFADAKGDATSEYFPDLLHPNTIGYKKWAEVMRPVFAKLKLSTAD